MMNLMMTQAGQARNQPMKGTLAAEGKPHGIRVCAVYPGAITSAWGAWSREERLSVDDSVPPAVKSLPPEDVARLIVWIACAPTELVLNEVVVTPLEEPAWP